LHTAFITHADCLKHEMMPEHPECPERLRAIEDQLLAVGLFDFLRYMEAPKATVDQLARVHDREYIKGIFNLSPMQGLVQIDGDTAMNSGTLNAALRAAGAAVLAADQVMDGQVDNAFCAIRPPGHHAERRQAMGFCFFNNAAVGAAHALEVHGLDRVAIVDFDVHHGNGTEEIFNYDTRVMVCSCYQHPFYPYTGMETVDGHFINVPLTAGSIGGDFRQAVETQWMPQLVRFRPQMIFVSAGFDAHYEDDMAELNLGESDYAWITHRIMEIAERFAEKRIVSVLEGGYALHALGRSVTSHIRVLMQL
jgi:acetoin utilization deacetylase AcuC-like enzyme